MSKVFIPLSLMTMSSAFAEAEIADNSYQSSNCCPTNCCKPCCVPQPKKCIDCECYNPQYYDLQCDWGMFFTADFLYWYARETNIDYSYSRTFFNQPTSIADVRQYGFPTKHHYVKSEWKPGFRVGLGMNMECDGWDLYANYTWFHNHSHSRAVGVTLLASAPDAAFEVNGLTDVVQPWASQFNENPAQPLAFPSITGKWSLIFNQIDLELGRKYWVSKCMTLRPYLGLRGAWNHTNFTVIGQTVDPTTFTAFDPNTGITQTQGNFVAVNNNRFKNEFWGVGLLGGLQPEFMLGDWCGCGNFSIYGNFEGSLIWGDLKARNAVQFLSSFDQTLTGPGVNITQTIARRANPVEKDKFSRMQGILDLGLGLRWEEHWCCDRYSTSIDLGWEHHYWFEYGVYHRPIGGFADASHTPNGGTAPPFTGVIFSGDLGDTNIVSNLGFGGLVIRARFDF